MRFHCISSYIVPIHTLLLDLLAAELLREEDSRRRGGGEGDCSSSGLNSVERAISLSLSLSLANFVCFDVKGR